MKTIKNENAVYMVTGVGAKYEIENQCPPNSTQYSRFADNRAEAEKIYQEELIINENRH
jgi:hypothetical protein